MPTVVTRYVNTGSSAGGDGTTNGTAGSTRAWPTLDHARSEINTAYSSNLVTADVQIELECSGATDDTTAVTNTWATSDATRYIHVKVPTADRKVAWDANAYTLATNASGTPVLTFGTNTIRFTGIQFDQQHNSAGAHGLVVSSLGGELHLNGVKVRGVQATSSWPFQSDGKGGKYVIRNCVTAGWIDHWLIGYPTGMPANTELYVYNLTIIGKDTSSGESLYLIAASSSGTIVRVKNNLMHRIVNGITTTGWGTVDNASNSLTGSASTGGFVDFANYDYSLNNAADAVTTEAVDTGSDLSAVGSGQFQFAEDGYGWSRPVNATWDRGAHEYGSAAVSTDLRATQLLAEVAVTPSVALHITQLVAEALVTDTTVADLRASQLVAEVFHAADPALRASQLLAEILATPTVALRASQLLAEVLVLPDVQLRASQLVAEVLVTPNVLTVTHTGLLFPRGSVPPF